MTCALRFGKLKSKKRKDKKMAWGPWQILLVIVVLVLVFGSKKLPELARALGKAKGEFKKGTAEGEALLKEEEEKSKKLEQKEQEAEKA